MKLYEILGEEEARQWKLSWWDVLDYFKISDKDTDHLHDWAIPWLNDTNPKAVEKLLKEPKFSKQSQVTLAFDLFLKPEYRGQRGFYGAEITTIPEVEKLLEKEVTLWRGGGGTYDKNFYKYKWASFTHDKNRVKAFSEYDGTYSQRGYHTNSTRKEYWVVELTLPIKDILLYLPNGLDSEVIVSVEDAKQAKVIKQT